MQDIPSIEKLLHVFFREKMTNMIQKICVHPDALSFAEERIIHRLTLHKKETAGPQDAAYLIKNFPRRSVVKIVHG